MRFNTFSHARHINITYIICYNDFRIFYFVLQMEQGGLPMFKRLTAFVLLLVLLALSCVSYADTFDPTHATAYMEIKFQCNCTRGGTGAMIGRRGLVTAAHNLYCHQHGKGLKYCNFYFGAKGENSCWYKYSGNFTYSVYNTFANGYSSANDIGYVVFDSPVGDQTGWFGWITGHDSDVDMEFMNVLSYDSRRHIQNAYDVGYLTGTNQVYWYGYISGSEGGPVYLSGEGMGCHLVAVYTSHDSNGNGYGRRLTSDIINDMRADGAFK